MTTSVAAGRELHGRKDSPASTRMAACDHALDFIFRNYFKYLRLRNRQTRSW